MLLLRKDILNHEILAAVFELGLTPGISPDIFVSEVNYCGSVF